MKWFAYLAAVCSLYRFWLLGLMAGLVAVWVILPHFEQATLHKVSSETVILPASGETAADDPLRSTGAAAVGQEFASLAELKSVEAAAGFLPTGYFGDSWPAIVTRVQTADDSISFVRQNGIRHTYRGYEGYRIKLVRLRGRDGAELLIVFRSVGQRS